MYRTRLLLAAALVPLAAGLTISSGAPPASASALPRLLSCGGARLLRPSGTVVLSCADGNSELRSTQWRSWTATSATGTTDFGVNLCTPTCVASRMRLFPGSSVELLAVRSTAKGALFSRVVVTYKLDGKRRTFTAYPAT